MGVNKIICWVLNNINPCVDYTVLSQIFTTGEVSMQTELLG